MQLADRISQLEADLKDSKAESTTLKAQLAAVKEWGVRTLTLPTENHNGGAILTIDEVDELHSLISPTPEALAVVEGVLVHKDKFNQQSVFVDDQAAIWRPSECEHPEYRKALLVVLPRSEGGE